MAALEVTTFWERNRLGKKKLDANPGKNRPRETACAGVNSGGMEI
jgi:hypothetical protein